MVVSIVFFSLVISYFVSWWNNHAFFPWKFYLYQLFIIHLISFSLDVIITFYPHSYTKIGLFKSFRGYAKFDGHFLALTNSFLASNVFFTLISQILHFHGFTSLSLITFGPWGRVLRFHCFTTSLNVMGFIACNATYVLSAHELLSLTQSTCRNSRIVYPSWTQKNHLAAIHKFQI